MTITWETNVNEIVWESQTAPGITWTTVVGGTGGTEIPARRLLPNTVGTPGQTVVVNEAGTAVEYVDDTGDGAALSDDDPAALGVADPGTSDDASRSDHVHPMPTAADVGALDDGAVRSIASGYAADALSDANDYTDTAVAGKQAADADLTAIAALAPADDALIQRKSGAWTSRTPAQVKADMSIGVGDVSGLDENTRDVIGTALVAGSGVAVTVDDPGNTITIAVSGVVADAINDGTTTVAPSQNAVFDALALKAPIASPTFTGTVTVPDASFSLAKLANISTPRFLGRRTASSGPVEEMTAAQAQSLLGDVQVGMPPVVGGYLHPPSIIASSARSLSGSLSNARTYANPCPIWVPSDCTIDALLAYQNVAATDSGATAELALSSPGPWPFAGTLLTTPVSFDATVAAGLRTVSLASPLVVNRGLYWAWLKFKTSTTAGTNPQFAHVGTLYTHYPVNSGVAPASSVSTVFPYGAGLSGTASMPNPSTISTIAWGNASQYVWIAARVSAV